MKITYECKNEECQHHFDIKFTHSTPNRHMSGRMEDAEQGDRAESDPYECPECGTEVDTEELDEIEDDDDYPECEI